MKPSNPFVSLALAAVLAGCASQPASDSQYVPESGGPGYGSTGPGGANTVPGDRPPAGTQPQGSSGTGVTGSGNAGTYGAGESGSAPASTGGSGAGGTASGADLQAMCALQQRLKAAHSEPERQAILDQAMPDLPPDLRQQHLEMLRQQCH